MPTPIFDLLPMAACRHAPICLSQATWWAVQEAAKQCVAARLRTHHGGPAQTLAALEQALQAAMGSLRQQEQQQPGGADDGAAEQVAEGGEEGNGSRGTSERQQAAVLLLLFLQALEQGVSAAGSGGGGRAAPGQAATTFFAANDKVGRQADHGMVLVMVMVLHLWRLARRKAAEPAWRVKAAFMYAQLPSYQSQVCQAWFARVRLLLLRAAAAAQLHELAAYHALLRLRDLQQQLHKLLPAEGAGAGRGPEKEAEEEEGAAGAKEDAALSPVASLVGAAQTPLAGRTQQRISEEESAAAGANPAAVLLAATRGSPDAALRREQQLAGAAGAAHSGRGLSQQQLQAAAAKVAEAAAVAAAAMCALGDAEAVAGLQAFCRGAFQPLLQHVQQAASGDSSALRAGTDSAAGTAAAAAAATAAWDWLEAVQHQAAGRYEDATRQYRQLYTTSQGAPAPSLQCVPAGTLTRLAAEAYAAVGDAAGLRQWLKVCLPCSDGSPYAWSQPS